MLDQLPEWMQQSAVRSQLPSWMQDPPPKKPRSLTESLLPGLTEKLKVLDQFVRHQTGQMLEGASHLPEATVRDVKAMAAEAKAHPRTFVASMVGPGELGVAAPEARAGLGELITKLIGKEHNPDVLNVVRPMVRNEPMPRITSVNAEKAQHMAKVYESLPKNDPAAKSAYDALNREVAAQMKAIKKAGYKVEYVAKDPYANSAEMMKDVRENKRLQVFKTPGDNFHPYMTPKQNDMFRAVHDWIAHAGPGNQFGPQGEENAYRMHAATLSPEAQRALATETRGQNSWVNFGPNAHLPVKERPFAEQKAALWPADLLGDYDAMHTELPYLGKPRAAIKVHVPGEPEPRTFTGAAHPQARLDAEDALGDLLDENFEPRFQIDEGFVVGPNDHYLTREEGLAYAKRHKQLGGSPKIKEAVTRSGQLKSEGLLDVGDAYANASEPAATPGFGLGGHIPAQRSLEYFRGPRTDPAALAEAYERSRKAFRHTGRYSKYLKEGGAFPGAAGWYDTRGIYRDAAEEIGPEEAAKRVNALLGTFMPASTARSAPPNNLKRAFMWQQLADQGLVTPDMLEHGPLDVPAGFGHFAQSKAHQPALARSMRAGVVDPLKNPKPASFGQNLTGNMKPGTFDTVMSRILHALDPKTEKFFDLKDGDVSPRSWAYQPFERGLADAANDAAKSGLLDLEPGMAPTASYQSLGWHGATKSAEYGSMYDVWNTMRDASAALWGVTPAQANRMIWKEGRVPLMPLDTPLRVTPRK